MSRSSPLRPEAFSGLLRSISELNEDDRRIILAQLDEHNNDIEELVYNRQRVGLFADRPASAERGDLYVATDTGAFYLWNGSGWSFFAVGDLASVVTGHDGVISTADVSSASYAHWPPTAFAERTSPAWATACIVQVNITGIYHITATGSDIRLRTDIEPGGGGTSVANGAERKGDRLVVNDRFGLSWADKITGLNASTSYRFQVAAYRASGSGALRADASCDFDWTIHWLPS